MGWPFQRVQSDYILTPASQTIGACVAQVPPTNHADEPGQGTGTKVLTKTNTQTAKPPLYKVLILNDDYTPMEFVVHVLERFFGMTGAQAVELMLTVHRKGLAVVGVFAYEIAETKVTQVMDLARRHQHPLQCTMEKEE
jgi:ATP-dependent Clp protease adaptor protein ClpS